MLCIYIYIQYIIHVCIYIICMCIHIICMYIYNIIYIYLLPHCVYIIAIYVGFQTTYPVKSINVALKFGPWHWLRSASAGKLRPVRENMIQDTYCWWEITNIIYICIWYTNIRYWYTNIINILLITTWYTILTAIPTLANNRFNTLTAPRSLTNRSWEYLRYP